jgi:hypothetical protein
MGRIGLILRLYCCSCCVLAMTTLLRGEEPAEAKLQKLADESRARAEGIQVSMGVADRATKAKVHPNPVMKYTDVPRLIDMATLWVWEDEGCPVALGKMEAYRREGGPQWLYCFASASTGMVNAAWPNGRRFRARAPGIEWTALKDPVPLETASSRLRQMKAIFRRFSATVFDDHAKTSDILRPLARPLYEYSSPKQGVQQGILCGFAANGTNPDVIIALEAVSSAKGKDAPKSWRYGVVRMTATGVSVKLDKAEVFTQGCVHLGDRDTWTYFWEGAPKK